MTDNVTQIHQPLTQDDWKFIFGVLEALRMARDMIATERQSFADCNVVPELTSGDDPDNFISIGGALFEQHDADVVADYDRALAKIDAALAAQTDGQGARPAFWTTMAHIDAAKAGRPMYVSARHGVEFCVPVHFGKPQPADDFKD